MIPIGLTTYIEIKIIEYKNSSDILDLGFFTGADMSADAGGGYY